MPMFYMHLRVDGKWLLDEEGIERPDLETVKREALDGARDVMSTDVKHGRLNLDGLIAVDDQDGTEVFRLPFDEALSIVGS